jgi:hypothetical protein
VNGMRPGGGIDPVVPPPPGGGDEGDGGGDDVPMPMMVDLRAYGVAEVVGIDCNREAFGSGGTLEVFKLGPPAGGVEPRAAALAAPAAAGGGVVAGSDDRAGGVLRENGRSLAGPSLSYARPASDFVFTSRSITALDGSSILMNLTPMPAGCSPSDTPASRFHTMRPTPAMTA